MLDGGMLGSGRPEVPEAGELVKDPTLGVEVKSEVLRDNSSRVADN